RALARAERVPADAAHILQAAAGQLEATQRRRVETDEKRKQRAGNEHDRRRGAGKTQRDRKRDGEDDVAGQRQPQPMPQHPPRRQQKGPEREAIAHEDEALGIGRRFVRLQRGLVHGVDGHGLSPSRWQGRQPPSEPLVEGTSLAARGSIATAARNARAKPLKQDSAIWWSLVPWSVVTCSVTPLFVANA